jgi:two-component system sporulation sensor kinase B
MKDCKCFVFRSIVCIVLLLVLFPSYMISMAVDQNDVISTWRMKWVEEATNESYERTIPSSQEGWLHVDSSVSIPSQPLGIHAAWIQVTLPQLHSDNLGLYIEEIYAQNITIYLEEQQIYKVERNHVFANNRIFLVLDKEDSGKHMYIWVENRNPLDRRIGLNTGIQIGNYYELLSTYVKTGLVSLILGCSFIVVSIILLICAIYLLKKQITLAFSLGILMLMIGLLFVLYPNYLYIIFHEDYGSIYNLIFDFALFVTIPALLIFFEHIFGPGYVSMITRLRQFQVAYSIFCIVFMLCNMLSSHAFNVQYYFVSVTVFGILIIIHLCVLCYVSLKRAMNRSTDGIIFAIGIALLTSTGVADLVWFYILGSHQFVLWQGGVVCFVISLIVLLGRNLANYQRQLSTYTNKLEEISHQLQRSEKMAIISELAASIAHEVRNPLQVTRGFLQLFAEKTDDKEKQYMLLAIQELDRAANIITDYLTFAKPHLDDLAILDVEDELRQIESIIVPLANLQGGKIVMDLTSNLYVLGSSAKFKQAMINMIKNSIEAFHKEGMIHIKAFRYKDEVVIQIIDNGVGMDTDELMRLGEPYFSTKTKGTGLGLMVTFRIIEIMRGTITFNSTKGESTEVLIRFPYENKQLGDPMHVEYEPNL